jgi:hypothetical protein
MDNIIRDTEEIERTTINDMIQDLYLIKSLAVILRDYETMGEYTKREIDQASLANTIGETASDLINVLDR